MNIDKIEAFQALAHFGIRIARPKYVDSADAAIAFAERRNALDPRLVPIVLRLLTVDVRSRAAAAAEKPLKDEKAIRQAFDLLVSERGTGGARILAQVSGEHGTDIVISGGIDDALGKIIALHSATHVVRRMVPLDAGGVHVLVQNFAGFHRHWSREHPCRMLENLLNNVSKFFESTPVTKFELNVRLHENSYAVRDVSMTSREALHLSERLDSRAHDRKGDGVHPAGRQ